MGVVRLGNVAMIVRTSTPSLVSEDVRTNPRARFYG